jgi:hypothetical protein
VGLTKYIEIILISSPSENHFEHGDELWAKLVAVRATIKLPLYSVVGVMLI